MRRSLLRVALFAAAAMTASSAAHAQFVSVYGLFNPTHYSNVDTGSVCTNSTCVEQTTSFWSPQFGGGVTLNLLNLHVVKLGLDVRGGTKSGTTGADTVEGGLRLGINPPVIPLKPYIQASVGYLATRTVNITTGGGGGTFNNNFATYSVRGGVDKPLMPFLDWRIAEIGFVHGFNGGISFNNSDHNANGFSLATGLVAHF